MLQNAITQLPEKEFVKIIVNPKLAEKIYANSEKEKLIQLKFRINMKNFLKFLIKKNQFNIIH